MMICDGVIACIGAEQRRPHPLIQRPPLLGGNVFATPSLIQRPPLLGGNVFATPCTPLGVTPELRYAIGGA